MPLHVRMVVETSSNEAWASLLNAHDPIQKTGAMHSPQLTYTLQKLKSAAPITAPYGMWGCSTQDSGKTRAGLQSRTNLDPTVLQGVKQWPAFTPGNVAVTVCPLCSHIAHISVLCVTFQCWRLFSIAVLTTGGVACSQGG